MRVRILRKANDELFGADLVSRALEVEDDDISAFLINGQ